MTDREIARAHLVTGDITEVESLTPVIEEYAVAYIIHLAGLQVPTCKADPRLGALVNVVGTINVFEAARRAATEIKGIVYASSAAVFGRVDEDRPMTERDEPQTQWLVGSGEIARCRPAARSRVSSAATSDSDAHSRHATEHVLTHRVMVS